MAVTNNVSKLASIFNDLSKFDSKNDTSLGLNKIPSKHVKSKDVTKNKSILEERKQIKNVSKNEMQNKSSYYEAHDKIRNTIYFEKGLPKMIKTPTEDDNTNDGNEENAITFENTKTNIFSEVLNTPISNNYEEEIPVTKDVFSSLEPQNIILFSNDKTNYGNNIKDSKQIHEEIADIATKKEENRDSEHFPHFNLKIISPNKEYPENEFHFEETNSISTSSLIIKDGEYVPSDTIAPKTVPVSKTVYRFSSVENLLYINENLAIEDKIYGIIKGKVPIKFKDFSNEKIGISGSSKNYFLRLESNESFDSFDDNEDEYWSDGPESIDNTILSDKIKTNLTLSDILHDENLRKLKWYQIVDKMQLNILSSVNIRQRKLQDAKFELIQAEWSYNNALEILIDQFAGKLIVSMSYKEYELLFGNINDISHKSMQFIKDLERCWENNIFLDNFCEIICNNIQTNFNVFITYFANLVHSELTYEQLMNNHNRTCNEILNHIEEDPKCGNLHLQAYQLLPIRKITNFPALLENILSFLEPTDKEYSFCHDALEMTLTLIGKCKKAEKESRKTVIHDSIISKLEFQKNVTLQYIGIATLKFFVKSDEVELIEYSNTFFNKIKVTKKLVQLFLFNDVLVIAGKKTNGKFLVIKYYQRINLKVIHNSNIRNKQILIQNNINIDSILCMQVNACQHNNSTTLMFHYKTMTDLLRWSEALDPSDSTKTSPEYDNNFIKKVIVHKKFNAVHEDEMNLTIGDTILVSKETNDGWYFGQNIKDGETGWLNKKNTLEIVEFRERIQSAQQTLNIKNCNKIKK